MNSVGYFLGVYIPIPVWQFAIAQFFGIITIVFDFWSFQIKNQRKYLLTASISSFFWMLMFITMAAQVPIILAAAFSVLRGMVFWWIFAKDSPKRKKGGRIFLYVALAIGLGGAIIGVVNSTPETRVLQIVRLATALLFVVGQYLPSKHYLRIFALLYNVAVLLVNTPLDTFNPIGIIIEAAKIISIIVFYFLWFRRIMLKNQLVKIKGVLAGEVAKINDNSSTSKLVRIMPKEKLEALSSKMVRYELATLDKEKLVNFKGIEEETLALLQDIKIAHDTHDAIEQNEQHLHTADRNIIEHISIF